MYGYSEKMRSKTNRKQYWLILIIIDYYQTRNSYKRYRGRLDIQNPFNMFYFNTVAGMIIQINNLNNIPYISQDLEYIKLWYPEINIACNINII